jgi:hypothetical protein
MEAGKNSVIYMGLISGPNKADDTSGRTTVTGTMDRGFTVIAVDPGDLEIRTKQYCPSALFKTVLLSLLMPVVLSIQHQCQGE